MLKVILERVRPSWDEMMNMDLTLAEAVLGKMPRLESALFTKGG